jgi:hypothetical protein
VPSTKKKAKAAKSASPKRELKAEDLERVRGGLIIVVQTPDQKDQT